MSRTDVITGGRRAGKGGCLRVTIRRILRRMSRAPLPGPLADPRVQAIYRTLEARTRGQAPPEPEADLPGSPSPVPFASVALVVRPRPADLEALLIRRAAFEGDPWSGHVALPGGRRSPADRTTAETAIRETREEVGIDLSVQGTMLGRLDDVRPRSGAPPVSVAAYVFAVPGDTGVTLNHEVESARWAPIGHLMAAASAMEHVHTLASGEKVPFPAIGYQEYVIWGLTHRILTQFCGIIA